MIPNSFFVDRTTLNVWLENDADTNKSVMQATVLHAVHLCDFHYTIVGGLTLEYRLDGFKERGTALKDRSWR
jgi:hypothetical protein